MKGQKAQKGTLKKVLHYIRPYWALVGLSVLLAAVTVAASLYIPILTSWARATWTFPAFYASWWRWAWSSPWRLCPSG